jgi:hypothetical protein
MVVDTSLEPDSVTIDTSLTSFFNAGYLWIQVPESGTVTFDYSVVGGGAGQVSWGAGSDPLTFPASSGSANLGSGSGSLDLTGGEHLFFGAFAQANMNPGDPFVDRRVFTIDNFKFTAVPEPETWALLGAGFAVLGLLKRK